MSFLNKKDNSEEEVINAEKERSGIRKEIKNDLKNKLKFSNSEINEVMEIIDTAEKEIDYLKNSLARVNINNENTEKDVELTTNKIREAGEKMALGIRQKTAEILLRKQKK